MSTIERSALAMPQPRRHRSHQSPVALILGGGRGDRLYPLTKLRSKPAVPMAGKYRLIDIPISNCLNSGFNQIYVLTQFNSISLHRHIANTYKFDVFSHGFVEILAAQQTPEYTAWYQGTADAVRRNLRVIEDSAAEHILVLSGDQLYRMDFQDMLINHVQAGADMSIAVLPVPASEAYRFGILKLDESGRVVDFREKPKEPRLLDAVRTDPAWIDARGIESHGRDCVASMGIYLFNRDVLWNLLVETSYTDFGKEIFPNSIRSHHVQAHLFDGYWEDIGTIKSLHQANIALTDDTPPVDFIVTGGIYSRPRYLPASRLLAATLDHALITEGCTIESGATIVRSVVGIRSQIGRNVMVHDSVLMGADYYEPDADRAANIDADVPPLGIGAGTVIERAIIDKNCRIGRNVRIINEQNLENTPETPYYMIRDGIVVIPKGTVLPDNTRI